MKMIEKDNELSGTPDFIKKMPHLWRWVLFIPSAVIASLVTNLINKITISNYLGIDSNNVLVVTYISFIISAVFVYVGSMFAPKSHFVVSLVLAAVLTVLFVFSFFGNLISGTNNQLAQIVYSIAGICGSFGAVYAIHKDSVEKLG